MLTRPPANLLPGDSVPYGRFLGNIRDLHLPQWDAGARWRRRLERKAWVFAGVYTPKSYTGIAIADAGLSGHAFAYSFDREEKFLHEESITQPMAFVDDFSASMQEPWELKSSGKIWQFVPEKNALRISFTGKKLSLALMLYPTFSGLTAIARAGDRPFNSTYKIAGIRATGWVRREEETENIDEGLAIFDYSAGYPPRHTRWNWACFTGHSPTHRLVGVNLVEHHNEGLENGLWLDEEVIPLAPAKFAGDHIHTTDDRLKITFDREGARDEAIELGVMRHVLTQSFGTFRGTFRATGGDVTFDGMGVVEKHEALW